MPKYIDIHCHVNFKAFQEDGEAVIKRALGEDTWLINIGSQDTTSSRAIEIAHRYPEGVYACIGLHPIHLEESYHDPEEVSGPGFTSRAEVFDHEKYLAMARDSKVVAIGECGLDYFHFNEASAQKQKEVFTEQVKIANEAGKPLMIHVRNNYENLSTPAGATPQEGNLNAYSDVVQILKEHKNAGGVVHCFEGDWSDAEEFLALDFFISFSGNITYKPRKNKRNCNFPEIIKKIPLDRILTDTDSPYLAPVPYRGERNEPVYVREIVKKIAEIKGLPEPEVATQIVANARRLFKI